MGGSIGPPSIFQTIQPIDMKLGVCIISVQLNIVTWQLIVFHGNHSNMMPSLVAANRHLGFSNFQFFFSYSNLNAENSEKTTFSDWNLQNCKIHCKDISI